MIDFGVFFVSFLFVVIFYCGGWCFYCNFELCVYQKVLFEIMVFGVCFVVILLEMFDNMLMMVEKNVLSFEVLSDMDGVLVDVFGICFQFLLVIKVFYQKFGYDLLMCNGDG